MEPVNINIQYIYYRIYNFVAEGLGVFFGGGGKEVSSEVKIFSLVVSCLLLLGVIYNLYRTAKIYKKRLVEYAKIAVETPQAERNKKWEGIKTCMDSGNPSDWKMAIMQADAIVDDIIKRIGYEGSSFGERLAQIKPSQFKNLEEVWHAHKMRNRIAHEGDRFQLTKNEAEYILGLYQKALEELEYI